MKPFTLALVIVSATVCGEIAPARAQHGSMDLQKIYLDESHCLVSPEIRNEKDNAISCSCRDAIADARYLYLTYILGGKDTNLNGILLSLHARAREICGAGYDVLDATESENWKWSGPEVVRTYPPDDLIRQITPDSRGWISVQYTVVLLWRNSQGRVTKTESFSAVESGPAKYMLSKSPSPERPADKATPKK